MKCKNFEGQIMKCKNCGRDIIQTVSGGDWYHVGGGVACGRTLAEPEDPGYVDVEPKLDRNLNGWSVRSPDGGHWFLSAACDCSSFMGYVWGEGSLSHIHTKVTHEGLVRCKAVRFKKG